MAHELSSQPPLAVGTWVNGPEQAPVEVKTATTVSATVVPEVAQVDNMYGFVTAGLKVYQTPLDHVAAQPGGWSPDGDVFDPVAVLISVEAVK
jgi:hypothetical protein